MPKLTLKEIKKRLANMSDYETEYIKVNHPIALGGGMFEICKEEGNYIIWLWDAKKRYGSWIAQGAVSAGPIYRGGLEGAMKIISYYRREKR